MAEYEYLGIDPPFAGVYSMINTILSLFDWLTANFDPVGEARQDRNLRTLSVKSDERLFLSIARANMEVCCRLW